MSGAISAVRMAKDAFNDHCERHRCRTGQCETRKDLWLAWMRQAEIWGGYKLEQGDPVFQLRGML